MIGLPLGKMEETKGTSIVDGYVPMGVKYVMPGDVLNDGSMVIANLRIDMPSPMNNEEFLELRVLHLLRNDMLHKQVWDAKRYLRVRLR